MNKIKLKKEFLKNELCLPYDNFVEDKIVETSEWSIHYELVFEYEGKLWKTEYSEGATDLQNERPWEYQDEVECVEVHPVQKMITVYEVLD